MYIFTNINDDSFSLNTAGYIKENGDIITLNEYHGEDESLRDLGLVEFSNTHPEDDTCIRVYKKPTEEQVTQLIPIIDKYLDMEGYCKVEIWKGKTPIFYNCYSLYENACGDFSVIEKVGNWTGYKLVQILKNQF